MALWLSYVGFCKFARRVLPIREYKLREETRRDLKNAELDLRDEEFAAGLFFSLLLPLALVLVISIVLLFYLDLTSVLLFILSGILLICLPSFILFQLYPSVLAAQKLSRARGEAITTLLVLCFNLLHHPDLRRAILQACKTEGKLSSDFRRSLISLERAEIRETREILTSLSKEWAERDETISEALLEILRSQTSADEDSRKLSLQRTSSRIIEEVEREAEEKLGGMISPTIYFLSFGSLAVVLVIGLSPLFGMFGLGGISMPFYLFSVTLLTVIFWTFTFLALRKRPLFLPSPTPTLKSSRKALLLSLSCFLPFVVLALRHSLLWFLLGVGLSLAAFCFFRTFDAIVSRRREEKSRREWRRLISFLGEKMREGRTFVDALREACSLFPQIGPELRKVLTVMQTKSIDPYSAFFEEGNAPSEPLISRILETSLELRRRSEAACANALIGASDMIERLERVERRFRERMREAVSNLWMISIVLLPLVCSISVWVVQTFTKLTSELPAEWFFLSTGLTFSSLPALSFFVGILCLALSLSVARYIAGINAPGDKILLLQHVGKTTLLSTSIYLGSLLLFSSLV